VNAFVLTGSIASGKSSVCKILKSCGIEIVDADVIAKRQLELHCKEVIELFGDKICKNGIVDRGLLADIIFSSKKERKKLNNLLHPLIREAIEKEAKTFESQGKLYMVDIPLFFESTAYEFKKSVVVYAPPDLQLKRLMARDCIDEKSAKKRINSQIDIEKKREMADLVIDNSSDLEHLEIEVKKFIRGQYASIKV